MFGFKSLTAVFRKIKAAIDDNRATKENVDHIKEIVQNLERDLPRKLDNAIKEIEFVRQRTSDVDHIKEIVQNLERDLPRKLDNAINEIEFVRRRTSDVDHIKEIVQNLERDLPRKLDNAINEIEFVRRRTSAFLGEGVAMTYLTDQSPIFVDPRDSGVAAAVLNGGLYEPENLNVIMSFVRPDSVFLDLGANVGIFSLQVARRLRAGGKVHAFEPQAHLVDLVRRSAFLNGLGSLEGSGTIECHNVGASDKDAKVGFSVPAEHLGGGRVVGEAKGDRVVAVVRLDGFFPGDFTCDLVKIDVEGHELSALRGMERILANSPRVKVLFENMGVSASGGKGIEDFFADLNFDLYGVSGGATLVPLKKGELASCDGYALAAKVGDPDLAELDRRRFFIYPGQWSLQSATLEDGALKCKGGPGSIAFHGPYWFLPRGQYRMQLHGELKGSLLMTIATRFGYPLTTCAFADGATSSQFTIERDAVFFECVARLGGAESELSLQRLEVIYC